MVGDHSFKEKVRMSFKSRIAVGVLFGMMLAAPTLASPVWTAAGTISNIEVIEDGGFLIYTSVALSASCTAAHAIYVEVNGNGVTADGVKALLATALAALSAGRNVQILYDDSTQFCYGKYVQISS
jgi:hypothetical protein